MKIIVVQNIINMNVGIYLSPFYSQTLLIPTPYIYCCWICLLINRVSKSSGLNYFGENVRSFSFTRDKAKCLWKWGVCIKWVSIKRGLTVSIDNTISGKLDLLTSRAFERVARLWARSAIVKANDFEKVYRKAFVYTYCICTLILFLIFNLSTLAYSSVNQKDQPGSIFISPFMSMDSGF